MAVRLSDTWRIRVVSAWRGAVGEEESLETKVREEESFGRARVPSAKGNNGTPPDFELCRKLWTGRRSATSRQGSGTQACHMHHGN